MPEIKTADRGMLEESLDISLLDSIIKDTLKSIESSKSNLFDIAETSKNMYKKMQEDLDKVNSEVKRVIDHVDRLDHNYKKARVRLMDVSKDFSKYSETEIKNSYHKAQEIQVQLAVEREREVNLRGKRDELTRSLVKAGEMVNKAEDLVSKVDIALTFLSGNLNAFSSQMESMQQKQLIGAQVILAQEEERKRVAREIHDGPAQAMANVVLRAELCEKLFLAGRSNDVTKELGSLKEIVKDSLKEVRRIIFNLRPMTLDDLGLIPTIKRYIEELKTREGFVATFEFRGEEKRLKNIYEVALFRLIQESLNNCKKYAQAQQITVKIELTSEDINVQITDDGQGFDLQKIMESKAGKASFGLLSMKERMKLINGNLEMESAPGQGTKIRVHFPMKEAID